MQHIMQISGIQPKIENNKQNNIKLIKIELAGVQSI
jgi:hypothetical protein